MSAEITIVYRVYPRVSKRPAVFANDKRRLVALGLRSLNRALGDLDAHVIALLDACPDEYAALVEACLPGRHLSIRRLGTLERGVGNFATFALQVDELSAIRTPFGMFAEDDYFYLPNGIRAMVEFARAQQGVDFVTPFDHPAFYWRTIHQVPSQVTVHEGRHWRTVNSTCLTFMGRREAIRLTKGTLLTYARGNHDASMWMALTKEPLRHAGRTMAILAGPQETRRLPLHSWRHNWSQLLFGRTYCLWAPVPSLATHLEATDLAPGIDWLAEMAREMEEADGIVRSTSRK
jgi:hypothetical protein